MFKDVFNLLMNNLDTISINRLLEISENYSIVPYVYYILYHTGMIYDNTTLRKYISSFKTPEGTALLNCYGLNESERHEWKVDFMTRYKSNNLYSLIEKDLTEKDIASNAINKKVFLYE